MASEPPHLLFDLPPELLLLVSEHLPDSDVASLALCNHALLSFFPQAHKKLALPDKDYRPTSDEIWHGSQHKINEERNLFLNRLSRDFPEFYLCFTCRKLNLTQKVRLPYQNTSIVDPEDHLVNCWGDEDTWTTLLDPFDQHEEDGDASATSFRIHFVHVQLVMRGLLYGPRFGIPVQAFSTTKVQTSPIILTDSDSEQASMIAEREEEQVEREEQVGREEEAERDEVEQSEKEAKAKEEEFQLRNQTTLYSLDARAESNPPNFYIRSQSLLVIHKDDIPYWAHLQKQRAGSGDCECRCTGISRDSGFRPYIEMLVKSYFDDTSKTTQREGQCDKCFMSWLIKIRRINEDEACVNLTQWRNLGPGVSPDDTHWLMHVGMGWVDHMPVTEDQRCDPRQKFEECLIPAEGSNALSEEELFDRNISLLNKQRYRTVMAMTPAYFSHGGETWEYAPTQSEMQQSSEPAVT